MANRVLSSEIVSLIHHVELNESGWSRKASLQLIQAVLWIGSPVKSISDIKEKLYEFGHRELTDPALVSFLDTLISKAEVVRVTPGSYKLTEENRAKLTKTNEERQLEQQACHDNFVSSCTQFCPELDPDEVWKAFRRTLAESIEVTGANLYKLLIAETLTDDVDWFSSFLDRFPAEKSTDLKKVVEHFFSPKNVVCRAQVLRMLTAYFFSEASNLSPKTISLLEGTKKKRVINIVLDTNFIFSILKLHDNPSDDAARSLVDLAKQQSEQLKLRLYVLPSTVEEAVNSLVSQRELVQSIQTSKLIANVAITQPLSGIAKKYFESVQKGLVSNAAAFFNFYIDDLSTVLAGYGIDILEIHPGVYKQNPAVLDDVNDELAREASFPPGKKKKGYEALLHDAVLWHAVHGRRQGNSDSPFLIDYWAVSIDWRLIAFDRRKQASGIVKLPIILHPSNLVQLLQFWVVRTKTLEDTLIDSIGQPLFFQTFDSEDEKVTIKVLQAISRFENENDLHEETLKIILANKSLRERISENNSSTEDVFALVREELLSDHKITKEENLEIKSQLEEVKERVIESEKKLNKGEESFDLIISQKDTEIQALKNAGSKKAFVFYFFGAPIVLGIFFVVWGRQAIHLFFPNELPPIVAWLSIAALALLPISTAWLFAGLYLKRHPIIKDWYLCKAVTFFGKKIIAAPGFLAITAIYQGWIWDTIKLLTKFPTS